MNHVTVFIFYFLTTIHTYGQFIKARYHIVNTSHYGVFSPDFYHAGGEIYISVHNQKTGLEEIITVDSTNYKNKKVEDEGILIRYYLSDFTVTVNDRCNLVYIDHWNDKKSFIFYDLESTGEWTFFNKSEMQKKEGKTTVSVISKNIIQLPGFPEAVEIIYKVYRERPPFDDPGTEECHPKVLTSMYKKVYFPSLGIPTLKELMNDNPEGNNLLYYDALVQPEYLEGKMYEHQLEDYSFLSSDEESEIRKLVEDLMKLVK